MNQSLTLAQMISVVILPLIFAITLHEVAHGFVAYLLGDKTPRVLGRLTLNPLKHIDAIGTIVMPILTLVLSNFVIGWAKPVPINSRNLRKPKRDLALIAGAGPFANLIMALFWAAIARLDIILLQIKFLGPSLKALFYMGMYGIQINLMLMLLNLLPIPPLDGGHILVGLLPRKIAVYFERIFTHGFIILLILLAFGVINFVIDPAMSFLFNIIRGLFGI